MKNQLRCYCAILFALLSIFFASALSVQSQTREAYVAQSEDKTTLTFYYDAQRNAHTGKTWDIEDVFTDEFGNQFPAWAGTYTKENTTVKKVIFDASFNKFRPTSTKEWFLHCSEMTQIDGLEHLNTDNVTNMKGMFYSCSNLTSLNLQHFNTEKVESMRVMFTYCSELTSLDLSNFNTAKVTDMFQMFAFCSKLTSIDLKNFNTSKVTDMQDMFVANSRLASLDLKSFNTDKVINMEGMFAACTALKYLDLSNFKPQKGTNMQQMFARSPALKTIRCNTNWATENSKSKDMFSGCVNLKGAVAYDANKTDATMANPETGYFTAKTPSTLEAYVAQSEDKTTLTFYYDAQRNAHTGKTWDIEDVFTDEFGNQFPAWAGTYTKENTTVKKVIFDASFNKFRPTSTKEWFLHCSEMTQIDGLEHLNTDNVTNMKGMFYSCSNLTSLNLQHFNTEKVESMRVMFTYCSELTSLDLSNFNTAKVTDMFQMFAFCSKLTSIDLKNFNTSKVTDMQDMFVANSRLASLDLKSFNTDKVINMEGMFAACTALKYLDLSNFKPQKGTNMQQMFARSPALKTIRCNTNWATENSKSKDMFSGCVNLKGAVAYDANKTDATMANPETGYFANESTAIQHIGTEEEGIQSIYTLQGKRVREAWKHLPAGVYVVNGKKIIK